MQNIRRDALMWRSLNHEFVLPFLGIYDDETALTPYMTNGTLAHWQKAANPPTLEVQKRVCLFLLHLFMTYYPWNLLEVAQGIHYIHSEGVVHGSLRGVNCLYRNIVISLTR